MKIKVYIIVAIASLLLMSIMASDILPQRRDLGEINIVSAIGLDKAETGYNLTFLKKKNEGSSGTKSEESTGTAEQVIKIQSHSYNYDIRLVQTLTDKFLSMSHTGYYFVGEETAKTDLDHVIDTIAREYQTRLAAKVYIIKGMSAEEFLNTTAKSEYEIVQKLKSMEDNLVSAIVTEETTLTDIGKLMLNRDSSGVIPVLNLEIKKTDVSDLELKGPSEEEKITEYVFDFNGVAIIHDMKLVEFLDEEQTKNYNYVVGKNNISEITLNLESGTMISFGLEDITSKLSFEYDEEDILKKIIVNTKLDANYEEVAALEPVFTANMRQELEKQIEIKLKEGIEQIFNLSKEKEMDFMDIQKKAKIQNPYKFIKNKENFIKLFKESELEVNVDCNIQTTYDIVESNWKQEGEKQ